MWRSVPFRQLSFGHASKTGKESLFCEFTVVEFEALTSVSWSAPDRGTIHPEASATMVGRALGRAGLVGVEVSSSSENSSGGGITSFVTCVSGRSKVAD
ncbi:hypothetical protein AVEN_61830-1 [Araneus ventricosus]|uniref:Uncharacterized protein n=1 Tax=Araneus ventricosus TaxID=182803 RepID=A0A4Y2LSN4_ARAVE|nr:hypothetical protein AVEN_61830-1 [Araneus ventricosus]